MPGKIATVVGEASANRRAATLRFGREPVADRLQSSSPDGERRGDAAESKRHGCALGGRSVRGSGRRPTDCRSVQSCGASGDHPRRQHLDQRGLSGLCGVDDARATGQGRGVPVRPRLRSQCQWFSLAGRHRRREVRRREAWRRRGEGGPEQRAHHPERPASGVCAANSACRFDSLRPWNNARSSWRKIRQTSRNASCSKLPETEEDGA